MINLGVRRNLRLFTEFFPLRCQNSMHKISLTRGLFCLLFLSLLIGCHGKKSLPEFAVPDTFDESKQIEITFWAKNDTNKVQVAAYENAIAEFEKIYPNVKVALRLYTDYNRIYNDVITNISTNTTPNVCITYPDHIATYKTGVNVVVSLDELADNTKYGLGGSEVKFDSVRKDEIVPQFLNECRLQDSNVNTSPNGQSDDGQGNANLDRQFGAGGILYALPFMRSTEALYINKNLVEKLGYEIPENITWDFVWEVSEAAMAKIDEETFAVNNQKIMIPFIYKSTDNMMIQYLEQSGAGYSDSNGNIKIFNDTTKNFLFEIAEHAKTRSFSTFQISSYPGNFFNIGQCIFAIDSTAGASWLGSNAPLKDIAEDKFVQFETVVRPVPQVDPSNPKMISQGPSICIFNKTDPNVVLASWLFAQYLLTNKTQITYAQSEGYIPVTLKAQNTAEYKDYLNRAGEDNDFYYPVKIAASKLLLENTQNTFVTPVFNGSVSLRNAAGQLIENVVKSERRNETVDEAYMKKNFDDVTALYRLNEINNTQR